jgi:hypothetical protein
VDNKSKKSLHDFTIGLRQYIDFTGKLHIDQSTSEFEEIPRKTRTVGPEDLKSFKIDKKVGPMSEETWTNGGLIIPNGVTASSNGLCSFINVRYCVYLKFSTSGVMNHSELEIPVTIGNIPFDGDGLQSMSQIDLNAEASSSLPSSKEAEKKKPKQGLN